jgi:hypothetical protein
VQAVRQNFGLIIATETSTTGRLTQLSSGPYGLQLQLASPFIAGLRLPPPVTAQLTRFKLQIGAVLLKRVNFFRVLKVPSLSGTRTLRVKDHRLVPHYLFRNPRACHGSWPFQFQAGFPGFAETVNASARCTRGRIPLTPPPSPSPPETG